MLLKCQTVVSGRAVLHVVKAVSERHWSEPLWEAGIVKGMLSRASMVA